MKIKNNQQLKKFASLLHEHSLEKGLLSKNDISPDIIWERHINNSAQLVDFLPAGGQKIADLGSGAGLPGIVLSLIMPANQFFLIEKMERRCSWLNFCINELGIDNASVVRCAVGDGSFGQKVDIVVSRAVAPLKKLVPLSFELLNQNGQMIALKGENIDGEIDDAKSVIGNKKYSITRVNKSNVFIMDKSND